MEIGISLPDRADPHQPRVVTDALDRVSVELADAGGWAANPARSQLGTAAG